MDNNTDKSLSFRLWVLLDLLRLLHLHGRRLHFARRFRSRREQRFAIHFRRRVPSLHAQE